MQQVTDEQARILVHVAQLATTTEAGCFWVNGDDDESDVGQFVTVDVRDTPTARPEDWHTVGDVDAVIRTLAQRVLALEAEVKALRPRPARTRATLTNPGPCTTWNATFGKEKCTDV